MKPSRNKGTKHFVFAKSNVNICMDKTKSTVCTKYKYKKNSLHVQHQEKKNHPFLREKNNAFSADVFSCYDSR